MLCHIPGVPRPLQYILLWHYRSLGGSLEGPLPDIITGTVPENSTHVYFKDMIVAASDDSEEESEPSERGATNQSGSEANNGKG